MARLHRASITPTKEELLEAWVPSRPWFSGSGPLTKVAAYRLDDPAGEVGVEGFVVQAGDGPFLHAVLTYRGTPLEGAQEHLLDTMEHSVLGTRWVYDGEADPVARAVLAAAARGETAQGEELFDVDGELVARDPVMTVAASGAPGAGSTLEVVHVLEPGSAASYVGAALVGTWPSAERAVLARLA